MTRDLQAEEERDDMERVKLDNKRILFNLLPAHVAQHFLMSNPRNMVSGRASRGLLGESFLPSSAWTVRSELFTALPAVVTAATGTAQRRCQQKPSSKGKKSGLAFKRF